MPGGEARKGAGPSVLVGRTQVLVPFELGLAPGEDLGPIVARYLARRLRLGRDPEGVPLWRRLDRAPEELDDLDAGVRALVGGTGAEGSPWAVVILELTGDARSALFSAPAVVDARRTRRAVWPLGGVGAARLFLFPLGPAFLVLDLDLVPAGGGLELRGVYARLRALRRLAWSGRARGLRLGGQRAATLAERNPALPGSLVRHGLVDAEVEASGPLQLGELASWLVRTRPDDSTEHVERVVGHRYAFLSTCLVLSATPARVPAVVWRVARGGPPGAAPPEPPWDEDRLLRLRANRVLGLSRDGLAAVSWPARDDGRFEAESWPRRWADAHGRLAVLALAERAALAGLAHRVTLCAADLVTAGHTDPAVIRQAETIALELVRCALSMTEGDSGGTADITGFFRGTREVLGVPALREEVLGEAKMFLDVVETERGRAEEARERRFQRTIGAFGAIAIPASVLTGFFGMNFPVGPGFWSGAVAVAAVAAGLGLAALLGVRAILRR